jgi:hypothetical protein
MEKARSSETVVTTIALQIQVAGSSKILVATHKSTVYHDPEDHDLKFHHSKTYINPFKYKIKAGTTMKHNRWS